MTSPKIDRYIAGCSANHGRAVSVVRKLVYCVAPEASESIQYKMPTFSIEGKTLCSISSRAGYIALYCEPDVVAKHLAGLKNLDVGKSCIRFKKLEDIDLGVVEEIFIDILKKHKQG